jgi:hypothetical protein
MREHDENKQQPTGGGWHHEEVRRHDLFHVIGQERSPRLRRRPSAPHEVFRDAASLSSIPSFNNSPGIRGAPHKGFACDIVRISARTSGGDGRSTDTVPALPSPKESKRLPVPSDDRLGSDDDKS